MSSLIIIRNSQHHLHQPDYEIDELKTTKHQEQPERISIIENAISQSGIKHKFLEVREREEDILRSIHSEELINNIKAISQSCDEDEYTMPYVFPSKPYSGRRSSQVKRVSYHCMDLGTPIGKHTFQQAILSASIAHNCADYIMEGGRLVYGLCRPPGHHAGVDIYGGYCYFNNAGVCANRLSNFGKVAILDIDYHHGNGTQDIFYESDSVFYASIHGDPDTEYPYFSGFDDEVGSGKGFGYNFNLPLPQGTTEKAYLAVLDIALEKVTSFNPVSLIVSLGLDTYKSDPICEFKLDVDSFNNIAKRIKALDCPTVVLQEGGYCVDELGRLAVSFFKGLLD
jgi:acetoin utilization deacetylase AcuC-like enzyme